MVILVSLLVALVGLLMYVLAANPKVVRVGEIMLFCGLLACLLQLEPRAIGILPR
jgi:hypothetical protein